MWTIFFKFFLKMLINAEGVHVLHNIEEFVIENFENLKLALFMRKIDPF